MSPASSSVVITGASRVTGDVDLATARWERKPPRLARMDRLCGLALLAAERALRDADLRAWAPERASILVGTAFGCHATNEEYFRGYLAHGPTAASPRLFSYTLPSSPLGEVSIHFDARGPAETFVSGAHAGVEALIAARRLCAGGQADVVVVIGVEVGGHSLPGLGLSCEEGAIAFVVESAASAGGRGVRGRAVVGAGASVFAPREGEGMAQLRGLVGTSEVLPLGEGDGVVPSLAALHERVVGGEVPGDVLLVARDREGAMAALCLTPAR